MKDESEVPAAGAVEERREHGAALDLMIRLKQAIDPANLLNPGKMALDEIVSPR